MGRFFFGESPFSFDDLGTAILRGADWRELRGVYLAADSRTQLSKAGSRKSSESGISKPEQIFASVVNFGSFLPFRISLRVDLGI